MESIMENFNKQFAKLIENIGSEIKHIEEELESRKGNNFPLSQIFSEIGMPKVEIASMHEILDSRVRKEKVIKFLTYEMRFLNSKCPHSDDNNKKLNPKEWLKSVNVVFREHYNLF